MAQQSSSASTEEEVQILPEFREVARGQEFFLYFSVEHPAGAFSYYQRGGDKRKSPPTIKIEQLEGVTIGEVQYPVPVLRKVDQEVVSVYEGITFLRVPIMVSAGYSAPSVTLTGTVDYDLWRGDSSTTRAHAFTTELPTGTAKPNPDLPATASSGFSYPGSKDITATLADGVVILSVPGDLSDPAFFDLEGHTLTGEEIALSADGGNTILSMPAAQLADRSVAPRLRGHLVVAEGQIWVDTALITPTAANMANASLSTDEATPSTAGEAPSESNLLTLPSDEELAKLYDPEVPILEGAGTTLWYALIGAFVGGILLNLMPCVFPVLSLKVLSFVEKAGEEAWKVRLHGILFTVGVLISMWALALILFAVQKVTGQSINWGQQMSYPLVVGGIVVVLFLLGLNMAGVFEVGTKLSSVGSGTQAKNGYLATLLSGVLTTVIATPCSGPFLGAAMSYTLSQPIIISLVLFSVFALGISLPYLLLSFFPALTAKLPRPGAWMETLKVLLSFGMFAAAAFFMQTFASLTGGQGLSTLVMALVIVGLAAYLYGHWNRPHLPAKIRYGLGTALPLVIVVAGSFLGYKAATKYEPPLPTASQSSGSVTWYDWRPGIVEYLRAEGYYVWVDYTATWCITCQVNKRVIFGNNDFVKSMDQSKIIFVKADMTDQPAVIKRDLARAENRKTIPVNIIYSPSSYTTPVLLEELISVNDAREALTTVGFMTR